MDFRNIPGDGTEPDIPLLTVTGPVAAQRHAMAFSAATGIDMSHLNTLGFSPIAVPVYPAQWPEGRRRWTGTKASAMWHPLMWLPLNVAGAMYDEEKMRVESVDEHTMRVLVQLTFSGLYDFKTGQWVDVLSTEGLDIDDPEVEARVEAWLNGASDEILDSIDLSEDFEGIDTETNEVFDTAEYGAVRAEELIETNQDYVYAITSDEALVILRDIRKDESLDVETAEAAASYVIMMSNPYLSGAIDADVIMTRWVAFIEGWDGSRPDLDEAIDDSIETFAGIHQMYWPDFDALANKQADFYRQAKAAEAERLAVTSAPSTSSAVSDSGSRLVFVAPSETTEPVAHEDDDDLNDIDWGSN